MERVLNGTSARISMTFYQDGVATNPSPNTATVTILREDGTTLVASTAATPGTTGQFTFDLTPTHTALLDRLRCRWTATLGGQLQTLETIVEVVGGFHFSLAEARRKFPSTSAYPTADLIAYRTLAEQAVEDAFGVAFVPRYARELFDGYGTRDLLLRPRPLSIQSVKIAGVALSLGDIAGLKLYRDGTLRRATAWSRGDQTIEIKYTHGHEQAPLRLGQGTLELVGRRLVPSRVDPRTTRITIEGATMEFGDGAEIFDVPELAALERIYGMRALVG